jgi:hypothetical protein
VIIGDKNDIFAGFKQGSKINNVPQGRKAAIDFVEIMNGHTDGETHAHYKGSLATKQIDELVLDAASGLCWLYNSLPQRRTVLAFTERAIQRAAATLRM